MQITVPPEYEINRTQSGIIIPLDIQTHIMSSRVTKRVSQPYQMTIGFDNIYTQVSGQVIFSNPANPWQGFKIRNRIR
jgi:hypothetical protein